MPELCHKYANMDEIWNTVKLKSVKNITVIGTLNTMAAIFYRPN